MASVCDLHEGCGVRPGGLGAPQHHPHAGLPVSMSNHVMIIVFRSIVLRVLSLPNAHDPAVTGVRQRSVLLQHDGPARFDTCCNQKEWICPAAEICAPEMARVQGAACSAQPKRVVMLADHAQWQ